MTSPEAYGAIGNGTTNDTSAVQAAINDGRVVQGKPGAVYSVTGITIPARDRVTLRNLHLKARSGTTYLCASANYLNNTDSVQQPIRIEGCIFDANDIATNALVVQSWGSDIEAECMNATSHGMVLTAETANNTAITNTLVDSRLKLLCHNNGGHGLFVQDSTRNKATDGTILPGSVFHDNGGYAANIEAGAGWDVVVRTYSNGGGVAFDGANDATRVHDSIIDDGDGTVDALPTGETYSAAVIVNALFGNNGMLNVSDSTIYGPVTSNGNGDAAPYGVWSQGNNYVGADGIIFHNYFDAARIIYSVGDVFDAASPLTWHNGSSPGLIVVKDSLIGGAWVAATYNASGTV